MENDLSQKKICIIGAGPSGLSIINSFLEILQKGEKIPELICYEKQSNWGGQWNFTYKTGIDEYGEPIHSSMYRHLWINSPKEVLEFSDFLFKNYLKNKNLSSFVPRESIFNYLNVRYSKNKKIREIIKFNRVVKICIYNEKKEKFIIKTFDNIKKKEIIKEFDFLICASGHFSFPNLLSYKGIKTFPGRILHSHDFKNPEEFEKKDILIIGSSFSAEDISSQCYKYNANSIILSYRRKKMEYNFPEKFEMKNEVDFIEKNKVFFQDGSFKKIDCIIFCTGYIYNFPFLEDKLKLVTENKMIPDNLYKGTIFINNKKLFFMGMQNQNFTFPLFEVQAYFIRDCILDKIKIPKKDEMIKDFQIWKNEELKTNGNKKDLLLLQAKYIKHLNLLTDCPKIPVDKMLSIFKKFKKHKIDNIMNFKDEQFESAYSGIKGEKVKKTWLEQMEEDENKIC